MINLDSERPSQLTEDQVTRMYQFRAKLWGTPMSDYPELMEEEGISGNYNTKKEAFLAWMQKNMPVNCSTAERKEIMHEEIDRLKALLQKFEVRSPFMVFGSVAKGVINHPYCDLDLLSIMSASEGEYERLEKLINSNFIVSQTLSPVSDLKQLTDQKQGLARLYSVTHSGVESEFHFLGQQDALKMHTIKPGYVERIKPVTIKMERLSNFAGGSKQIFKPENRVLHYYYEGNQYYRGFFPEVMLYGSVIHDPEQLMTRVMQNVWLANVKAFLFHNQLINKNGRLYVDKSKFTFDDFLNTCLPQEEQYLSPETYFEIETRFENSLKILGERLGITYHQ